MLLKFPSFNLEEYKDLENILHIPIQLLAGVVVDVVSEDSLV
jgi:hypothetical protein